MTKIDTKKVFKHIVLDDAGKKALQNLKATIKTEATAFHRFVASSVYLALHTEYTIDIQRDIIKTKVENWSLEKGWINQKLQCSSIIIAKKLDDVKEKSESEILDFLKKTNLSKNNILKLNKPTPEKASESTTSDASSRDKTTTPNPVPTPEKASESATSDASSKNEEKSDVQKAWDAISNLTPSEWEELANLANSQGYFFRFGKKALKQTSDLYGCEKAING